MFEDAGWLEAIKRVVAEEATHYVRRFDAFVRRKIGVGEAPALASVDRIQMLLRLMEWPGPQRELTCYLEIEHPDPNLRRGKINEYKEWSVFPDPLHIEAAGQRSVSPAEV